MRRRAIRDGFGREFRDMPARSNQRKPAQHGPHPLMKLQRSVGNQAVLRLLRSATVPADSGNTRLQRAVEYIDMTSDQAFEENREREIIQDWAGLVKKFPEFSGSPPLDEIVFQYGISIVKWKNGYTLNIQEKGWTYNQVPLSEVYQRLKRFEGFVKGKAIVTLDNGTSLIDPKGIGLSVTHSVLNAEGKKYTGYYKVMESVHKVEENQSYDLSVEAMGEFGDFHHFVQ